MWLSLGKRTVTSPIFGMVVFLNLIRKKLQSPIMRSYVKYCKVQVPSSCLSVIL